MNSQEYEAPSVSEDKRNAPVVTTNYGRVRGKYVGSGILAFLGIPYAAAPIAELRFMPPRPHPAWDEVLDADRYGATAPQQPATGPLAESQ